LSAYDRYLRGLACVNRWTRDGNDEGLDHFKKAIELEPGLAAAYGLAAWCYVRRKALGWMIESKLETSEAIRLARRAVLIGKDDPVAMCLGGYAVAYINGEFDDAASFMDQGLAVNPNYASAWVLSAWLRVWRGEPDLAIEHATRARRLSPLDPLMFGIHSAAAFAQFLARRYDEASLSAEQAVRDHPTFLLAVCISAASNALGGRREEAGNAISRVLEADPDLRLSNLQRLVPFRRPEDFALLADGLRKAGLPD
jgi:tetratricopeptide (TPR) repeat protein